MSTEKVTTEKDNPPATKAPAERPASLSADETLSRVDNYTNGVADRLATIANQYGSITLTDQQRSDMLQDIERLRAMGKDKHNPTGEPPHNPPAYPAFANQSADTPQPGPAPNNDSRLAEASTAGMHGTK